MLDCPFSNGSEGKTLLPGQEPIRWRIRDVRPPYSYVIDTYLEGAILSCEWSFQSVSDRRTRITQRIILSGKNAANHVESAEAGFGSSLADGMKGIAAAIAAAQAERDRQVS